MKENLKISIIMPLFNAEKTLKRALDSVLKQTYKNYEIIVIDGDSIDGTKKIIEEYRKYIAYYISEKDRGYGDALNKGIAAAKGDYSIILAGDDFFLSKGLENFVNQVKGSPDVFCGNMLVLKERDIVTKFERAECLSDLEKGRVMAHPATFFKVETLRKCGGYDIEYKINCDTELILRLYKTGAKFQVADPELFISVFVCGGMSVQEGLKDSLLSLNKESQTEAVAVKYGATKKQAKRRRKKIIYKKMCAGMAKKVFRSVHGIKLLYMLAGQKPLTEKEIIGYEIPLEYIR